MVSRTKYFVLKIQQSLCTEGVPKPLVANAAIFDCYLVPARYVRIFACAALFFRAGAPFWRKRTLARCVVCPQIGTITFALKGSTIVTLLSAKMVNHCNPSICKRVNRCNPCICEYCNGIPLPHSSL